MTSYVFDTSALIAWWHEIYPRSTFPDIARLIVADIDNEVIKSPIEVKRELEEKEKDQLTLWAKEQRLLFVPTTSMELQRNVAEISNKYKKLIKRHSKVNADPVVIALAQQQSRTVVTQENPRKQNNIVGCCRQLNVPYVSLPHYVVGRKSTLDEIRRGINW